MLRDQFRIPKISSDPEIQKNWKKLHKHPDPSGIWVGHAERIYFFFALAAHSWEAVGIWLVFKLGAKWEAWNHMGFVPEEPDKGRAPANPDDSVRPLQWARARRIWAAMGYGTFVVGTALNLFISGIGVAVASSDSLLNFLLSVPIDLNWK